MNTSPAHREVDDYEHRADCECDCGSISEGTDLTVAWEHDRHCECDCGAITE